MKTTTTKTKKTTTTFDDAELATLHSAARAVWDHIGYDVLQAVAEDKGKSIERVTIPRSHVLELVIDADRLREQLRRGKHDAIVAKFETLDYPAMLKLLKPAFSYARYGL